MPPPVPTKPKGPAAVPYSKPGLNTGTFPKAKPHSQQPQTAQGHSPLPPSQSQTLPLPSKQDTPPAATVRPFTPELPSPKDTSLNKPQTVAASSIYSMYTKQPGSGKPFQSSIQGALNRSQNRTNGFVSGKNIMMLIVLSSEQRTVVNLIHICFRCNSCRIFKHLFLLVICLNSKPTGVTFSWTLTVCFSCFCIVYGKPVIPSGGSNHLENPYLERRSPALENEVDLAGPNSAGPGPLEGSQQETERIPRPLSPTKLLPFISNPYRQSESDLEALRKKLYNAPRPLKKRSSITEPEGPAGPNIQKLLYQKTLQEAMETTTTTPAPPTCGEEGEMPVNGSAESRGLFGAENFPSETLERGQLPSYVPGARVSLPSTAGQTKPPSAFPDSELIIPPPPPSHPAPRPEDAFFPSPPSAGSEDAMSNLPPPPSEGFLEEFPPYPPPPYPTGAEQDSFGEDTFNMKAPEVTGQVTLPPV